MTLISCPSGPKCETQHKALPVVFSAGELTGNIFQDFNVGFIPLYITVNCNVDKIIAYMGLIEFKTNFR